MRSLFPLVTRSADPYTPEKTTVTLIHQVDDVLWAQTSSTQVLVGDGCYDDDDEIINLSPLGLGNERHIIVVMQYQTSLSQVSLHDNMHTTSIILLSTTSCDHCCSCGKQLHQTFSSQRQSAASRGSESDEQYVRGIRLGGGKEKTGGRNYFCRLRERQLGQLAPWQIASLSS